MGDNGKGPVELYRKYRPTRFDQVVGQDAAVKCLRGLLKTNRVPHYLLFAGPSGCGKTTLARIMATKLGCTGRDLCELNCAESRGIDDVRAITRNLSLGALRSGSCRVLILDEAHKFSVDAQSALLKPTEDIPNHVYFFVCTTEPDKLHKTLRTRGTRVQLGALGSEALGQIVRDLAAREGKEVADTVVDKIVDCAESSGRCAAILYHQVCSLPEEEALATVVRPETEQAAEQLVQIFLRNQKATWAVVAKILTEFKDDPEGVRRRILGCAAYHLLQKGDPRARRILDVFQYHFFDSGKPGLVRACHEIFAEK